MDNEKNNKDEKNKNIIDSKNTVSNQAEPGRVPEAIGKLPLNSDVNNSTAEEVERLKNMPGMPAGQGGRKGNVSVEDGGDVNGASTASR